VTSRERWVVYPLLFLTLGITMRDKVWPFMDFAEVTAGKITCNQLEVGRATVQRLESVQSKCRLMTLTGQKGRDVIRLGAAPNGTGRLELLATDGDVLVTLGGDVAGKSGRVETFADGGVPQTQLRSTEVGGLVTAIGRDENIWLILGHYDDQYGVFAESAEAGRRMPLTLPWRFETSPPDEVPTDATVEDAKPDEEEEPVE